MASTTHPSKEQVRQWMSERQEQRTPPPSPQEVKRQLGWGLLYEMDPLAQECQR